MSAKRKSFINGAMILAVAGIIVKVLGALFRIPLANMVGAESMAYYEVVYPYYAFLLIISSSGLPTAISKQVAECVALNDYRGAKRVFRVALVILLGIGVVTSLVMLFSADALAKLSTFDAAAYSFRALAPALLLVSVMCAYRGYLQGMQMMTGTALSQVAEQVGKLVIGLALAAKFLPMGPEYAAMGALLGVTASEAMGLIVIVVFYLAKRKSLQGGSGGRPVEPAGAVARTVLLIAIPITIGASISPLSGIVDSALIGRMLRSVGFDTEAAATAFSLLRTYVTTLVNMPAVLTTALAMSLVPAMSAFKTAHDVKGMKQSAEAGMKLALLIGFPCAVGLFVLGEPIIDMLYSNLSAENLATAGRLMKTASIGVLFLSLVQTMTGMIQGLGKPMVPVVNLFIGFVLKVIAMVILVPIAEINIHGAAASTVICYAVAGVLDTFYLCARLRLRFNALNVIVKPLASSVVMGAAAWFVYRVLHGMGHNTLATVGAVAIAMVVYVLLILLTRTLDRGDLELIPGGRKLGRLLYGKKASDE